MLWGFCSRLLTDLSDDASRRPHRGSLFSSARRKIQRGVFAAVASRQDATVRDQCPRQAVEALRSDDLSQSHLGKTRLRTYIFGLYERTGLPGTRDMTPDNPPPPFLTFWSQGRPAQL